MTPDRRKTPDRRMPTASRKTMARLVVVGISLATGIGAAVLASGLKPPEILPVIVAKDPVSTIVVAAAHLEYGTTLTDDNVSETPWESSIVPEGAFTSKADLLKDGARAVLTSMERNEPVVSSRITGPNQPASLAALTEPGMRAVAVRVDEARGVAGFVRMGDRVDVILTRSELQEWAERSLRRRPAAGRQGSRDGPSRQRTPRTPDRGTDRDRRGFDRAGAKAHSCRERGNTVARAAASQQSESRGHPAHNLGGYWRIRTGRGARASTRAVARGRSVDLPRRHGTKNISRCVSRTVSPSAIMSRFRHRLLEP